MADMKHCIKLSLGGHGKKVNVKNRNFQVGWILLQLILASAILIWRVQFWKLVTKYEISAINSY
jgi:hypothetical protein